MQLRSFLRGHLQVRVVYVALALVLLTAAVVSPDFFKTRNLLNVLRQASAIGVLAIGQTVVIIGGGIDLSVAAVMQLVGVTIAEFAKGEDGRLWFAIPLSLAMALGIGLGNGFLVAIRGVQPFIATLFVGVLVTGLRLMVTRATPSGILPPAIKAFGGGSFGSVPNAVLCFAGVALIMGFVLQRTTFGRRIFAVGGNPQAAELSGVRVKRVVIASYVISALLAAVAGMVLVGYLGYADQEIGTGYDLDSIAAAVVGGTVLGGGVGSVSGTVAGIVLMASLLNIVLLLNLNVQYQLVIRGLVILAAMSLQLFSLRTSKPTLSLLLQRVTKRG